MVLPWRANRHRKPSHFGSYCHSSPRGIASTERASMAIGGADLEARDVACDVACDDFGAGGMQPQRKTAGFAPAVLKKIERAADQTAAVIHCCSFAFGAAPTW